MESDSVPNPPGSFHPPNLPKESNCDSKKKTKTSSQTNTKPSVNHGCRDVYNFNGASNIQIGHTIYFGTKKKSKASNPVTKKKEKEPEIPPDVKGVMRMCLEVTKFADIAYIKGLIKTPWEVLARKIKAHINSLTDDDDDDRLSQADAVEEVLLFWIEEHADSALVAILVENLWELSEKEAAIILAREHLLKKK